MKHVDILLYAVTSLLGVHSTMHPDVCAKCPLSFVLCPLQASSTSTATLNGATANGYDYLKPRVPVSVTIPTLQTATPFSLHPATNPYVETPTTKCPITSAYDMQRKDPDSPHNSSFEIIEQELDHILQTVENINHNNNTVVEIETAIDSTTDSAQ